MEKEIKITKAEGTKLEELTLMMNSPALQLTSLHPGNAWQECKSYWDMLAEKYNFDPHNYTYVKDKKAFVLK